MKPRFSFQILGYKHIESLNFIYISLSNKDTPPPSALKDRHLGSTHLNLDNIATDNNAITLHK